MPITRHAVAGSIHEQLGTNLGHVRLRVSANVASYVDQAGNDVIVGAASVTVNPDGTWLVTGLLDFDETADDDGHGVQYRFDFEYLDSPSLSAPQYGMPTWKPASFSWFSITEGTEVAPLSFGSLVEEQYLPLEQQTEYRNEIRDLLAQAAALVGIDTSDAAMRYAAEHGTEFAPFLASLVDAAAAAKFTTLAADVVTLVVHGSNANAPRGSAPGRRLWIGTVHPNNYLDGDAIATATSAPVEPSLTWLGKFVPASLGLSDGSSIASWTNDGTGPPLIQAADATRRPVMATIGGRKALTFDGVNDRLEVASWGGSIGPATYIIVYRPTAVPTGASTDYIIDTFNNTSTNRHRIWLLGTDGVHMGSVSGGSPLTVAMPAINQWHIASFAAGAGGSSICRHDGVDFSFNPGGAGSDSMSLGGVASASVNQGLIGAIGDVRVANSALSLPTIQSVEQALAYQYGITLP